MTQTATKVKAGGIGGALTAIIVWGLREFGGVEVPGEIGAAIATVVGFAFAWFTPEKAAATA